MLCFPKEIRGNEQDPERDIPRCCGKVAIIVTGTIRADKIFKIVLYEIFVQLCNVARHSYCLLSAIRVVVT